MKRMYKAEIRFTRKVWGLFLALVMLSGIGLLPAWGSGGRQYCNVHGLFLSGRRAGHLQIRSGASQLWVCYAGL